MPSWRRNTAVFLLAVYIASGALLEFARHDHQEFSGAKTALAAQSGTRSTHPPFSGIDHVCPVCLAAAQRIATPASSFILVETEPVAALPAPVPVSRSIPAHATDLRKRGPPALQLSPNSQHAA